jgi:small subunit ribosomal protein S6
VAAFRSWRASGDVQGQSRGKEAFSMRDYELILVVHPDLDENAFSETVKRVSGWITDSGGAIVKTDVWGKRQLAYPIRKQTQGQYILLHTQMDPKVGATLERNLRIQESILRFLLVAKDE